MSSYNYNNTNQLQYNDDNEIEYIYESDGHRSSNNRRVCILYTYMHIYVFLLK